MEISFHHLPHRLATLIEIIGIGIIGIAAIFVVFYFGYCLFKRDDLKLTYAKTRQILGRGILLGLEFLVAADIIYTVAVDLTWQSVLMLGVIVLIRTFLSFTLEVELNGRWPWQEGKKERNESRIK